MAYLTPSGEVETYLTGDLGLGKPSFKVRHLPTTVGNSANIASLAHTRLRPNLFRQEDQRNITHADRVAISVSNLAFSLMDLAALVRVWSSSELCTGTDCHRRL